MSTDNNDNIKPLPENPTINDHARYFMDSLFEASVNALNAGVAPSTVMGSIEFVKADIMAMIQDQNRKQAMASIRNKTQGGDSKIILPPSSN